VAASQLETARSATRQASGCVPGTLPSCQPAPWPVASAGDVGARFANRRPLDRWCSPAPPRARRLSGGRRSSRAHLQ